jgi:hypothetical protein
MKSFLADRPRVTVPTLIHPATAATALGVVMAGPAAHGHGAEPGGASSVECVRQGDKITRLIVTCACGERIELDCLYAGG